jgi:hypothetical protein
MEKNKEAFPFLRERQQFKALTLSNPNYFGNLKLSPFKPVLNIQGNTTYEEIGSVGFQPEFNLLEAVVFVKQTSGYGSAICGDGTPEYVRFYLSYDNGATWQDVGVSSFTAYNIPAEKRLEYAVTLPIQPKKKGCRENNICLARAILSWNVVPPPNEPDWAPVWGNIHNTHIQIAPAKPPKLFLDNPDLVKELGDFLKGLKVPLPESGLDELLSEKSLSVQELQRLYAANKEHKVEPHRFALSVLAPLVSAGKAHESLMAANASGLLAGLGFDLPADIDWPSILFPTDGNTSYEELECVGLQPSYGALDTLAGVIRIKQKAGYSGNPCTTGSKEYVAFWADFDNNGSYETYLGTTSVNVHDIDAVPREGLEYAVFLPVDLNKYRQPCQKGPRLVKIRAILSWNVAPPPNNPNYIPVWGNREETIIHIYPGQKTQGHAPFIEVVGSMPVPQIQAGTGLADGASTLGFVANDSPFGGLVRIDGHIANPPDISQGASPLKYRILVRAVGSPAWQSLSNAFTIFRTQLLNGVWSFLPNIVQTVDADGYYDYQEDLAGGPLNPQRFVSNNVLGYWQTAGLSGLWQIRLEVKDALNNIYLSSIVSVFLDNEAPQIPAGAFKITSPGGNCADFKIGDVIEGTYQVVDAHFNALNLNVLPAMGGSFTAPVPLPRTYPTVSTNGEAGAWKLDTTGMPKCGYVVRLSATDRTIVNSAGIGFYTEAFVGLCLRGA